MATRDYTLGKGKVLFKPTGSAAYVDLGNAPAFNISLAIDKLEHLSSRAGLSVKDLEVITKMGISGSFTLDEPNAENLRMFVMSSDAVATVQTADPAPTIANVDLVDATALGSWFPLYKTAGIVKTVGAATKHSGSGTSVLTTGGTPDSDVTATRVYEVIIDSNGTPDTFMWRRDTGAWTHSVNVTGAAQELEDAIEITFDSTSLSALNDRWTFTVTVTPAATSRVFNLDTTAAPTVTDGSNTLTEGVDGVGHYQIDYKSGLIYINPNQPAQYALDGSETLVITGAELLVGTKTKNLGATQTSMKGDLYFVGDPPQGRIIDIMGYCSITPNGDFSLIGTDWMSMQFNIEFLEVTPGGGLITVEDRGKVDL